MHVFCEQSSLFFSFFFCSDNDIDEEKSVIFKVRVMALITVIAVMVSKLK